MIPRPLLCSTSSFVFLPFVTLTLAPFSSPLPSYTSPISGVSRLTYIWRGGPPGWRTNRPTWQVQAARRPSPPVNSRLAKPQIIGPLVAVHFSTVGRNGKTAPTPKKTKYPGYVSALHERVYMYCSAAGSLEYWVCERLTQQTPLHFRYLLRLRLAVYGYVPCCCCFQGGPKSKPLPKY